MMFRNSLKDNIIAFNTLLVRLLIVCTRIKLTKYHYRHLYRNYVFKLFVNKKGKADITGLSENQIVIISVANYSQFQSEIS